MYDCVLGLISLARSQHSGRNHIDKMEHNDPKVCEDNSLSNRDISFL